MYIKLRFFRRIRWFIRNQAGKSHCTAEEEPTATAIENVANQNSPPIQPDEKRLLNARGEEESKEGLCLLRRSVKELHFGGKEQKKRAALAIGGMAKEDVRTRRLLAVLGVIPPLVEMLGLEFSNHHRSVALQALIEIADGSSTNKALMVEAGILGQLSEILHQDPDPPFKQDLVILLLSMSTLPGAQGSIATTPILSFLLDTLDSNLADRKTIQACLKSLHNISTVLENSESLVSNGTVATLMNLVSEEDCAERALVTLGNLVVTVSGKNAIENHNSMPHTLVEMISHENKPKCQESAMYILMILAHSSSRNREKMAETGIVPILLELSLLGGPLAQKRAVRMLQWFKGERPTGTASHSGPQMAELMSQGSPLSVKQMREGRRAIREMVQESLHKNMESIMKRAKCNCTNTPDASTMKAFASTASSKSLPY